MIKEIKNNSEQTLDKYLDIVKRKNKYLVLNMGEIVDKIEVPRLKRKHYKAKVLSQEEGKAKIRIITYAPIHTHSGYSLLDGAIKIEEMVELIEYSGAITDHGVMHGFLDFYKNMKKAEKKPIIGFEAYTTDFEGNKDRYHLILLAKNNTGLKNLMKLTSESYNHFHYKPHVTMEALKANSEGIIATTACLQGIVPQHLLRNKGKKAEEIVDKFIDIFGRENFFIEIQRHGIEDEKKVEPKLLKLAKKKNVKIVAGTDAHYPKEEDAFAQEVLLCLQTGKNINQPHMTFDGSGYHLMSSEEVEDLFSDIPEALDNTLLISDMCNIDLELNNITMPNFNIPSEFKDKEKYFEHLCYEGFKDRFSGTKKITSKEYKDRLKYEIDMIKKMNFSEYFLIVSDFINYAKNKGIMVGPGRGSAVGSLVSYCLQITDIDPIPYGLFFERFLNPERVSWPDIDTDFDDTRRTEVIDYLNEKYGSDKVSKIITFGRLNAKSVVRDVTRVLAHPTSIGNKLAKLIPEEIGITIDKALNLNPELKNLYDTDKEMAKIIDISKKLEGLPRHASQHACGLVISKTDLYKNLPTTMMKNRETKEKEMTSQVTMSEVEELGLLKMDVLGLRTMGVIGNCFSQIKESYGKDVKLKEIPINDKKVYDFLKEGNTSGVFQLESEGMTNLIGDIYKDIKRIKKEDSKQLFERLIAAVALYRPGPMDYIPTYIKNMKDPSIIEYDHPKLEPILKRTYGVIVYQEQVMQIVQKLAGYSLGRADIVRKAMGKKKLDIMAKEKEVFIYGNLKSSDDKKVPGCVNNGVTVEVAEKIWDKMSKFAEYAFNKSHATAYAYIAIITAWLSYYYPKEFSAAMLNSVITNHDKLEGYLYKISKRGIEIYPPDINLSSELFRVENDGLRFGLLGIKHIGKSASSVISARKDESFKDLSDLAKRLGQEECAKKDLFQALVYSGTLDKYKGTRNGKIESTEEFLTEAKYWREKKDSKQISLIDIDESLDVESILQVKEIKEFEDTFLLSKEKEYTGYYLSGHPLDEYESLLKRHRKIIPVREALNMAEPYVRKKVQTAGIINEVKVFYTKTSDPVYNFTIEDKHGSISCVVFYSELEPIKHLIKEENIIIVKGTLQNSSDWGDQIIVKDILTIEQLKLSNYPSKILVDIHDKKEQKKIMQIAKSNKGEDVRLVLKAKGKEYPLKNKISYSPKTISDLKENFKNVVAKY